MPAKTPPAIIEKFHTTAAKVLQSPAMQQKLKQLAVDPMQMTPAEFDKRVADELVTNGILIKLAGIK
jgi:tripartite-type tricarboxylate transporter receptor subunit TctC